MAKKKKDDEKAYEVKDKRRVNPDGSLKEEPESKAEPAEQPAEPQPQEQPAEASQAEEAAEPQAEQVAEAPGPEPVLSGDEGAELPPPSVFDTLQFVTGLLAEQAWQFMGLHLPPGRKEPVVDMAQAKVAIDVVISIADKLHPHLDDESRRAIRGIISDLQINFVQHNK
jgi:hypothetical protein